MIDSDHAGVLGVLGILGAPLTKDSVVILLTIGYAGTDFIEGFMKTQTAPVPVAKTTPAIG